MITKTIIIGTVVSAIIDTTFVKTETHEAIRHPASIYCMVKEKCKKGYLIDCGISRKIFTDISENNPKVFCVAPDILYNVSQWDVDYVDYMLKRRKK